MLVLSRKKGERIVLTNGVTITLVAIKGNQVRVGVEAPDDVGILRAELLPAGPPRAEGAGEGAAP